MATPDQIANALLARYDTLNIGSPPLRRASPDVPFTPDNKPHLEAAVFFNRPAWEGLKAGAKQDQGLLQVTVVWPKGKGVIKPLEAVAVVMAHFPKGLTLAAGVKLVREPYASSPLYDADRTRVPVTITWAA